MRLGILLQFTELENGHIGIQTYTFSRAMSDLLVAIVYHRSGVKWAFYN